MGPRLLVAAAGNHVFGFVRVEDIAYDKRPGMSNVVYVVDSGRGTAGVSQPGRSTNGRVWKMVLDPTDPKKVTSLSILIEGDDMPVKTVTEIHQPDNIESTTNSLFITEDPGSSQQFPDRLDRSRRDDGAPVAVQPRRPASRRSRSRSTSRPTRARPTSTPPTAPGNLGAWESSGIVDASAAFGPGAFLVDVQAGTAVGREAPGR